MPVPTPEILPSRAARRLHGIAVASLSMLVLTLLAAQFDLTRTRAFDPDEFQHAHSAFLIYRGQVPYRDYFEHHPPLLHQVMAKVPGLSALVSLNGARVGELSLSSPPSSCPCPPVAWCAV